MSALLESFASSLDALTVREAAGLGESRRAALADALREGLPLARVEAWKYTSLRPLSRRAFQAVEAAPPSFDAAVLAGIPAPRLVFVNGRLDAAHTDTTGLPAGVTLQPLSQLLGSDDPRQVEFLARRFERLDEVFARVNAALADEGVILRAEAGVQAPQPIHLAFLGTFSAAAGDRAWHLRHVVELGEGASLTVVEHHLGAAAHTHLSNGMMHVRLAPRACLRHARVQDEATGATVVTRTDAVLAEEARYERIDLELGAGLSRHELNVVLQGDKASLHANGVLLGTGKRHIDTRLGIDHGGLGTASELTWRGLGSGASRCAFHGGILIRQGADGTEAALSNKNLLLAPSAEIDTQPVLEIFADEVKAAHGAAVGQLDPTAMFYLRSRGLPVDQARTLLTAAFCRETLAVVGNTDLREALASRLDAALTRLEPAS